VNSFWQRKKRMKRMNSISFQGLENQKTLESFWHKEEEEVQRDSKVVKDCIVKVVQDKKNANQSLAFIDFSCLVKRTIRRVMTFKKT